MRAEWFDFVPEFQLYLGTNHRPLIRGTDDAIWDRIRLVPFNVRFEGKAEDKSLPEKLRGELSGILNWAIEGALEWQREGLPQTEEVTAATVEYRRDMDTFQDFLDECCKLLPAATVGATSLYHAYREWANDNGYYQWSQKVFGQKVAAKGFAKAKKEAGFVYHGLRL